MYRTQYKTGGEARALLKMMDSRCPEARYKGDAPPRCDLNNLKSCIHEDGHECDYYNDWLEEKR